MQGLGQVHWFVDQRLRFWQHWKLASSIHPLQNGLVG
jgi:hypothetical protein